MRVKACQLIMCMRADRGLRWFLLSLSHKHTHQVLCTVGQAGINNPQWGWHSPCCEKDCSKTHLYRLRKEALRSSKSEKQSCLSRDSGTGKPYWGCWGGGGAWADCWRLKDWDEGSEWLLTFRKTMKDVNEVFLEERKKRGKKKKPVDVVNI